jgi:hypothetical protein
MLLEWQRSCRWRGTKEFITLNNQGLASSERAKVQGDVGESQRYKNK